MWCQAKGSNLNTLLVGAARSLGTWGISRRKKWLKKALVWTIMCIWHRRVNIPQQTSLTHNSQGPPRNPNFIPALLRRKKKGRPLLHKFSTLTTRVCRLSWTTSWSSSIRSSSGATVTMRSMPLSSLSGLNRLRTISRKSKGSWRKSRKWAKRQWYLSVRHKTKKKRLALVSEENEWINKF